VREIVSSNIKESTPRNEGSFKRMDRLFRTLLVLIPLGIIGNVLFILACTDGNFLTSITHFSPVYLVLAFCLSVIPWFTGSLRLFLWSRFTGSTIRYKDMFKIYLGAELGAAVTPPLIGGSAVKIGMLMHHGLTGSAAAFLALLESFEDCIFFIVMVPIALTFTASWNIPIVQSSIEQMHQPWVWTTLISIVTVFCAAVIMANRSGIMMQRIPLFQKCAKSVSESYNNFKTTCATITRTGKALFALTMVLTAVQWVCRYSVLTLLLMSLGIPAQPVLFMALQVLVFALLAFVPTPGGAGGAELMFSLLYGAFLPVGAIGIVTTGWRFITFYFLLLLAGSLFLMFGLKPATAKTQDDTAQSPFSRTNLGREL
jgi:hypothetical protein